MPPGPESLQILCIYNFHGCNQPKPEVPSLDSAFYPDVQRKFNNDRHHSKTDLAVVKQERQHRFDHYANP